MAYEVKLTSAAARELRKMPEAAQDQLQPVIDALADEPRPSGVALPFVRFIGEPAKA